MKNGEIKIESDEKLISEEHSEDAGLNPHAQVCLQHLLRVWLGFERDLAKVPLLRRIDLGTYTAEDHQLFLLNIRQQVIEGSRWITRTASSFDRNHAEIRHPFGNVNFMLFFNFLKSLLMKDLDK